MSFLAETVEAVLETFTVAWSGDLAKRDPELVHGTCDEAVCDVEQGDTLAVLVRTALHHAADCGS